jgi:hypothetical protein
MRLRALLFAPLLLAAVAATEAPKDSFTSGVWNGDANYDADGQFSDCTMTAQAKDGVLLGFVISADFDWGLVIADETRTFEVGARKAVLLLVDKRDPIAAVAKVLRIATDGAEFSFKLTGTADAIADLAACVTEHQGTARVQL